MKLKIVVVDLEISPRVKKWALRIGIPLGVVLGGGAVAWAGLTTWNKGDVLQAADLNSNFALLQAQVVPSGAVVFFNLPACPTGWSAATAAQGRYVVGLNPSGVLGMSVGTALSDQEDRPVGAHGHAVDDPGHNHGGVTGPEQASNGYNDNAAFSYAGGAGPSCKNVPFGTSSNCNDYWNAHTHPIALSYSGITVGMAGSVTGTNAPYVQYLACQKN